MIFLTLDEVLAIHGDQVNRFGGLAGVRDMAMLQAAIAMPMADAGGEFLHADLCEMAAAYLFHIIANHAFFDANKRTGAVAAYVFLRMNGWRLVADQHEYAELVLSVARGEAKKPTIAAFLRAHTTPT